MSGAIDLGITSSLVDSANEMSITTAKLTLALPNINKSDILRATIAKNVNDATTLPSDAISELGGEMVFVLTDTVDELGALINSMTLLGITNTSDMNLGTNVLNDVSEENIASILESIVVWNEFSKVVLDVDEAVVTKPTTIYDETITTRVSRNEITNLINGARDIGVLEAISNNAEITITLANVEADSVNASDILRATVAVKVSNAIAIPSDALDHLGGEIVTENKVLIKTNTHDELAAIIVALENFGITSLTSSVVIDDSLFTSLLEASDNDPLRTKLNESLDSLIMWNEMSSQILGTNTLVVPVDARDIPNTGRIYKEEIENFVEAMNALGFGAGLNNVEINGGDVVSLLNPVSATDSRSKIEVALDSIILWEKVSSLILDAANEPGSNLIVPTGTYNASEATGAYDADITTRIEEVEIINLLGAIKALGIDDINSVSVTDDQFLNKDDGTSRTTSIGLVKSNIMLSSIQPMIKNGILEAYNDTIQENQIEEVTTKELKGTLRADESDYESGKEGELYRLLIAMNAASRITADGFTIKGMISDTSSTTYKAYNDIITIRGSKILKPTVGTVLETLVGQPIDADSMSDEDIKLLITKLGVANQISSDATAMASAYPTKAIAIYNVSTTYSSKVAAATTVEETEKYYNRTDGSEDSFIHQVNNALSS